MKSIDIALQKQAEDIYKIIINWFEEYNGMVDVGDKLINKIKEDLNE